MLGDSWSTRNSRIAKLLGAVQKVFSSPPSLLKNLQETSRNFKNLQESSRTIEKKGEEMIESHQESSTNLGASQMTLDSPKEA